MIRVHALRLLVVVVPLVLVIVVLRGLGESCRGRGLPEGYGKVVETDRWCVYGPLGDPEVEKAGPALDAFVRRFHETYAEPFHLGSREDQITVYLFRRAEDFRAYAEDRLTDDTDRIAGYYRPGSWSIAAIAPDGLGLPTLRHEAVHAILDRDVAGGRHDWSPWLNEGLAQAFEEGRTEGGLLVPGPLRAEQAGRLKLALASGEVEPTERFVARTHDEFMADAALSYARAAALVLFLLETRRDDFVWYFDRERKPGAIDPAVFTGRFGRDLRADLLTWIERQGL